LLNAVSAHRPRIQLGPKATLEEVVRLIVLKKSMDEADLFMALSSLRDVVVYLLLGGRSVSLDGLCSYTPSIQLDGSFKVSHRMDKKFATMMNTPNAFLGGVKNRENIGLTPDELVAIWNEENPGDPIVLP
jgi:hypothetical protein